MRESLIAIAIIASLLVGGCLNVPGVRAQEVRHSPDIGLRFREGALAINALLEWLNTSGMNDLSINLAQAIISGNASELKQDLNRVELLIESTPALYAVSSEVLVGLKAAEGLNASLTPNDLASLLLVAYKQALRNNHLRIAGAILKVLNGQELSTEELNNVLTEIETQSNSSPFRPTVTSAINEVLKALHNESLLNPGERIEFAAKIAVKDSLLISALLQAYKPEESSNTSPNIREGAKGSEETRITPEDMVKAMYLLEKFGPKSFFVLKHLPTYRVLMEIIQPNSSALSTLKSIPYGALVSVEGVEGNYSMNKLKENIHSGRNYSVKASMSEARNSLQIPHKLLSEFKYLTNEIKKVTNTTYLNEGALTKKLQKTYLNSSIAAETTNKNALVSSEEIYLILTITSLIAVAIVWLSLYQTIPYRLPHAKASKALSRRMHPFWVIISKYAEEAGVTLKPSLTHREAYNLLISSAKRAISNSVAGLLKDLMMIYEFVTYRGENEALYANKVNEILRRLGRGD